MSRKVLMISILMAALLGAFQNCAPMGVLSTGSKASVQQQNAELGEIYMKDAEDECAWMNQIAPSLSSQPEGTTITGGAILQSYGNFLAAVKDGTGIIHLKGNGPGAMVSEIKNFQGTIFLCDMNIGTLSNFEGNVFVVKGNIGMVEGFTGNLTVVNGSINQVENSLGNFAIRDFSGKNIFRTLTSRLQSL